MAGKAVVALARCRGYDPPGLNRAIAQLLETLEPLDLPRGGRILLKPNCLSCHDGPDRPVNTRAEVVEAVGRYLIENHQARLVIADSGGLGSYGRSRKAYEIMGLDRVAQELGAELVNLERTGLMEIHSPRGAVLKTFQATALLDEVAAVVNLPKMKTHLLTGMTGAIKNNLGLLPGSLKRAVHVTAPSGEAMSSALVDIYSGISAKVGFSFHLMDAVTAMEGHGPAQGSPKQTGVLLASPDGVALDTAASRIMGFNPNNVATTRLAHEAGLGRMAPGEVRLPGAEEALAEVGKFRLPFTGVQRLAARILPRRFSGWALDFLKEARPRPVKGACQRCGLCVEVCPVGALTLERAGPVVSKKLCIECYCCLEHCPAEGLRLPRNMRERIFGFSGAGR